MAGQWEPVDGVFTASASWLPTLDFLDKFEFFPFVMTVIGVLAGALFAQRIAERSKVRSEEKKELREVNTAIVVAFSIASVAYSLKKHHIKKLKDSYDADLQRFVAHQENLKLGIPQPPFVINPEFNTFHPISPPVQSVQDIVLTRLSITGRALASVSAFSDAIANLNHAMINRNEILARLKDRNLPQGAEMRHMYLGIPYADGEANNEYGTLVKAMALYVDDVLFFGIKLCEDLVKHGKPLAERHHKKFGGEIPEIADPSWEKIKSEGLMPGEERYKSWLLGFQSKPEAKKRSRRQRLVDGVKQRLGIKHM